MINLIGQQNKTVSYLTIVGAVPRQRLRTDPSLTIPNTVFQIVLQALWCTDY